MEKNTKFITEELKLAAQDIEAAIAEGNVNKAIVISKITVKLLEAYCLGMALKEGDPGR